MDVSEPAAAIIAATLARHTGQEIAPGRRWRIGTALAGLLRRHALPDCEALAARLVQPGASALEWEVVEALLNNETYFFRDPAFFDLLAAEVLPDLACRRAATRQLRIWSAGCSTGQEVLSLAMLFADHPARWAGWSVQILGTDVSRQAIACASQAVYNQFEIQRGLGMKRMISHFAESKTNWQAAATLRALTRFEARNLFDGPPPGGPFDLVLCRNMLLYFDDATKARALGVLHDGLARDGWLMLGAGERVVGAQDRLVEAGCGASLFRPSGLAGGSGRAVPTESIRVA